MPQYVIYLFITTAILLLIIIIISNFAYGLFIISLFAASGYAVYLYKSIFSAIVNTTKSSIPIGIYLFEDILSFIFVCILIVMPFIVSSWREVKFERNGYVRDLHSFFKLFTYNGFSYFHIPSRFIFITAVVFTVIYFFIIKAFIQYGFGNITLNIAAGIILILSILLMQYRQAYVVMLLYSFSLSLLLSTYGLYNGDLILLCIFCAMLSIDIGYGIYYNVLGISQRYLTFIAIFEIALLSFLNMFNRSSSKGGRSKGISFRISRRGGGRSGGGGASR